MHGAHPALSQPASEPEIEVRGIDADEHVRRIGTQAPDEVPAHRKQPRQVTQHLDQPHHGERLQRIEALQPLRRHRRAADALEPDPGVTACERTHQPGSEQVPRELARHQRHALHGGH